MRKLLYILIIAVLFTSSAVATVRQIQLTFVDEFGDPVTSITSITVFNSGAGTSPTIYSDRGANITMVNPITTSSENSTFVQSLGQVRWFQQKPTYKITITDGTKSFTYDGRNEADTRVAWFEQYIGTAASLSFGDNDSFVAGSDSDYTLSWVNGSDILNWVPLSDGTAFNIGSTARQSDFNVFTGTGTTSFAINEGDSTMIWNAGAVTYTGGIISLNVSSNFATNINTGSSDAAVNIGSGAAGAISLDTTAGITVNADDSYALTVSAGTVSIAPTGGDLTLDATNKSVIIRGTEEVSNAILLDADGTAGGIHMDSGTGDITLDSGDDIFLEADTSSGDVISIINTQGTDPGAVILRAVAAGGDVNIESEAGRVLIEGEENAAETVLITADGGASSTVKVHADTGTGDESIFLLSDLGGVTVRAAAGSIDIEAVGGSDGDIGINAGDDLTLTSTGNTTFAVTGILSAGGAAMTNMLLATEAATGTSDQITAAQSASLLVYTMTSASATATLPDAAAGLWYLLVDGNASSGRDLLVKPKGGDTINGDSVGDGIQCVTDADGEAILIFATSGTAWYTATISAAAAWTEE